MSTLAKMYKTGELELLSGNIDERMPAVTSGLIAHFPLDGPGGAFDSISAYGTTQNIEQELNLIEALDIDWRKPSSWTDPAMVWDDTKQALKITGPHNGWLKVPLIIDPNKKYFCSIEVMVESRVGSGGTGEGLLYVGGHCTNAAGQRVTPNYDYSIVCADRPALGQWVTYKICRTGTGAIHNNTSYSFGTTDGWMGTTSDSSVTDKLAKYWYFGGLWNYSCNASAVTYIRNMRVVCMNPDTSGCTHTSYGMALEGPTTNLWSGAFNIYNNYAVPASLTKLKETYMGQPVYRLAMTPASANLTDFQSSLSSHGVYGSPRLYLANTKYVNSIFWRCVNKPDIRVGNTASNIGGWSDGPTVNYQDGWHRTSAYRTGTVTTDKTGDIFFSFRSPSAQAGETIYVDWACPQIEQGIMFPTSYVNGSRTIDSRADIKIALTPPYSINLEFTPLCPNDHNVVNVVFSSDFTINNDKLLIWKRDTENYYRIRVLSVDTTFTSNEIVRDVKATITVTVSSTQTKIYLNGVLKNTVAQAPAITSSISLGECQSATTSFNAYNSLSVYNRVLADDEVSRLATSKLRLMSSGDLRNVIVESPSQLPADAYYWPLGNDCYDITHQFGPSEASNVVFEDDSAWVGTAVTNMWDKTTMAWSSGVGTVTRNCTDVRPIIPGYEVAKIASTDGNSFQAILWTIPGIEGPGVKYTHSAYIYKTAGTFARIGQHWNPWTDASPQDIPNNRWTRLSTTITTADNTHTSVAIQYFTDGVIYVCCPQYEKKEFLDPFVYGTRANSSLEFNLNSSIGLQWNADFSIVYWKKPVATDTNDLAGYSLDSLGCNSNSVGGSYFWWGKSSGSNSLSSSTPGTITPATYFNNWRMISLVRSGSVITIKEWEQGGTVHVRTVTGPSAANAYVTQYGYDLKLCGWDNASGCNSYYRDLIVAKRVFTDAELTALCRTPMSLRKDNLCIQHKIIEV